MAKRLSVPPELEHLIEKREAEEERRTGDRREVDLGPLGAIESARDLEDLPTEDRRKETDRRLSKDRRGARGKGPA